MSRKSNGIKAERELYHMLWERGFAVVRVAGSGCMVEPSCDLLAGNGTTKVAIECKTTRDKKKYIEKKQMEDFKLFSEKFGLHPVVAIKFVRNGWWFIHPEQLEDTGKNFAISLEEIRKIGKNFDGFIGPRTHG